jgi:hypothetical protein
MENLILSSKKEKGLRLLIFFFKNGIFNPIIAIDLIGFVGILKLFSGEL